MLDIQSTNINVFRPENIPVFELLADQLAIAINNARLLKELEAAHAELVRTKTFEAIATATGEAIHWIGNKTLPISLTIARLREEGIPFVSVLTDPVYGGVSASLAMLGDVNVAEPKALIGFAGPRVIEQTIKQKLPENNGGYLALNSKENPYGKIDKRVYTELTTDHPIDLTRYQVANCYMGRAGLINSGGASSGESDLKEAVKTSVITK